MKKFRKIMAVLVAAIMVVAMTVPAFAATSKVTVTISYDKNGGTGDIANESVEIPANTDYVLHHLAASTGLANNTANQETFLYWSLDKDTPVPVDKIIVPAVDPNDHSSMNGKTIKVYAIWGKAGDVLKTGGNQTPNQVGGTIKINNSVSGETYTAYQLFQLFSWYDDDIRQDKHTDNVEAYSYYIAQTHPLYTWLRDTYEYDADNDKKPFILDENRAITIGGVTYTPVIVEEGFKGATTYDEDKASEYQASAAKVQAFAIAAMKQIEGLTDSQKASIAKGSANGNGSVVTITPTAGDTLPLGYYLVDSTLGSFCSLDTTNPEVTLVDKNKTLVKFEKSVEEDSTNSYGDKNDADFGQVVKFKSVVTIPLRSSKVVYHDNINTTSFSSLKIKSIKVGGSDLNTNNYNIYETTPKGLFKKTETDATTTAPKDSLAFPSATTDYFYGTSFTNDVFAIGFTKDYTEGLSADTEITIEYEATLTVNAKVGDQSEYNASTGKTVPGNDNKAWVTYGNGQESNVDWTRTYTWGFEIFKYAELKNYTGDDKWAAKTPGYTNDRLAHEAGYIRNPDTSDTNRDSTHYWVKVKPLKDAIFNVYLRTTNNSGSQPSVSDGSAIEFVEINESTGVATTGTGVYRLAVTGDESNTKTSHLKTPAKGVIKLIGLDANTEAGNITDKFVVKEELAPVGYNIMKGEVVLQMSSLTKDASSQGNDNTHQTPNTLTLNMGDKATYESTDVVDDVPVENFTSTELPSTGGMGTTVLYIVGGMLVILAGAYLFFSRKRTA